MKKTVTILLATLGIISLLAVIRYKPDSPNTATVPDPSSSDSSTLSPNQTATNSTGNTNSSPSASYKDGSFSGDTAETEYGPVQVTAVISGGKISGVKFLQLPSDRGHSIEVSNFSAPQLRQEALQAQSANVDIVSGATQTTYGFQRSLQSALDQARA